MVFVLQARIPGDYRREARAPRLSSTPSGSKWLYDYHQLTHSSPPVSACQECLIGWNAWIKQRIAADWQAENAAATPSASLVTGSRIPENLRTILGVPPKFAGWVTPVEHTVTFGANRVVLEDHPALARRFRFYRFESGVMEVGRPLNQWHPGDLTRLFQQCGLSESDSRVLLAVSRLEGGFDSVNTYDTGGVSAGFIQFSTGLKGDGALTEVLQQEGRVAPDAYRRDFFDHGIAVDDHKVLHVIDPVTGREEQGADAVLCVVHHPRLAAVFVHAGRHSREFQVAQVQVAMRRFSPGNDLLIVRRPDGSLFRGRVKDVVHSEAGIATLLEAKINTGKLSQKFRRAVQMAADKYKTSTWRELARHEYEIVSLSKNRASFLDQPGLRQPPLSGSDSVKGK
jgi:hypothetical protein